MNTSPVRNAYMDDTRAIDHARRAAWAVHLSKPRNGMGLRLIGNGHFSAVYSLSDYPNLVVKVGGLGGYGFCLRYSSPASYHGHEECCWPEYVAFTAGLPELPEWAPRVYHVEMLTGGAYFAVMERLSPLAGWERLLEADAYALKGMLRCEAFALGVLPDLHSGNFMQRGDTLVATDPWAGRDQ